MAGGFESVVGSVREKIMNILGIHSALNQFNHDPGAALICENIVKAVCEEERFNRVKSSRGYFPLWSIRNVLKEGGLSIKDIDKVYTTGVTAREKLEPHLVSFFDHYFGFVPEIVFVDHQDAHLASAFYCSGFDESMCLSYDGIGDKSSGKLAVGNGRDIEVLETIDISQSLGNFYSAMTAYLGFKPVEDEYKVMGLASYGEESVDLSEMVSVSEDSFTINSSFFRDLQSIISNDQPLYSHKLVELLGPPRLNGGEINESHIKVAYSSQKALEQCILALVTRLHQKTGLRKLCVAGGVGLNCSANSMLYKLPFLDRIFIQPASSDRGLPLGSALIGQLEYKEKFVVPDHIFLGPSYEDRDYLDALKIARVPFKKIDSVESHAAQMLSEGRIIGWFQGRSECGPRALGNRSILADPRSATMKDEINLRVKFREEFRPFAPAVLEEEAPAIFEMEYPSPFMTITFKVRPGWVNQLAAITHIDGTARVQTVSSVQNERFYNLIREFSKLSSVPVVLNTSFNARGEPIVETPANALATFFSTGLDTLYLGNFVVTK